KKEKLQNKIFELNNLLYKHELMSEKKKQHELLIEERKNIMEIFNHIHSYSELYEYGKKAEYQLLENITSSINYTLEEILQFLFEEPFYINIKLFKQNKTKKYEKTQINSDIKYRGGEYNNIRQLSG